MYRKSKAMITPHKQRILEGITSTPKTEELVATPDGPGTFYSKNRKAKGEGATADDFQIFRKRWKMMSLRLVKNSWNEKGVDNYF
jgi:hypothetical protein